MHACVHTWLAALLHTCTSSLPAQMSFVLSTLKTAAKGAQACEDAATAISGMSSDLETTAMFASYGAWKSDAPAGGGAFGRHHDGLVKLTAVSPVTLV